MPRSAESTGEELLHVHHAVHAVQDARKIVITWEAEFAKAPNMQKKLAMVYLANDILQNSRKKGPEFVNEFYRTLPRALQHMLKHGDDKVLSSTYRLGLICCASWLLDMHADLSDRGVVRVGVHSCN